MMGKGAWLVLGLLVGVVVAEAIVQNDDIVEEQSLQEVEPDLDEDFDEGFAVEDLELPPEQSLQEVDPDLDEDFDEGFAVEDLELPPEQSLQEVDPDLDEDFDEGFKVEDLELPEGVDWEDEERLFKPEIVAWDPPQLEEGCSEEVDEEELLALEAEAELFEEEKALQEVEELERLMKLEEALEREKEREQQQLQKFFETAFEEVFEEEVKGRDMLDEVEELEKEAEKEWLGYREREEGGERDMDEAVAFMNAVILSLFGGETAISEESILIEQQQIREQQQQSPRFLSIITGLVGGSTGEVEVSVEEELVMGGDADVEEEVVVFGGEGFGLNEEFCYQLPLELEVECLTAIIQGLRDENNRLRHGSVDGVTVEKYVNHHHHHHQDNLPLLVGGLVCVLVGVAIGRSLRKKRRPCKVHHYQAVNNNNNMKKGESLVEVEEREFYPYYVTANV